MVAAHGMIVAEHEDVAGSRPTHRAVMASAAISATYCSGMKDAFYHFSCNDESRKKS